MEAIKQDIGNRMHEIFEIKGLVQEIRQSFELKDHQKSLRDGKAYARDIAEKFQCTVIPPVSKDATAKTLDEYQNLLSSVLNEPCQLFESFQVSVKRESDLYENFFEEEDGRISAPGYTRSDVSFLYAVKFILVKYQYVMDSYERLKLCKQCEKLFFEKKIGSKDYCSPSCRKKYNDALQIPEIRKCREKQNAWIRYKYKSIAICPKVYFLYKDECNGCTGAVKGGDCQVLRAKNKKAFKVINQQK